MRPCRTDTGKQSAVPRRNGFRRRPGCGSPRQTIASRGPGSVMSALASSCPGSGARDRARQVAPSMPDFRHKPRNAGQISAANRETKKPRGEIGVKQRRDMLVNEQEAARQLLWKPGKTERLNRERDHAGTTLARLRQRGARCPDHRIGSGRATGTGHLTTGWDGNRLGQAASPGADWADRGSMDRKPLKLNRSFIVRRLGALT